MDHTPAVIKYTEDFLNQLGFENQIKVSAKFDVEDNNYLVLLQTEKPSLLIGYHGENLSALQLILPQHLHAHLNEWLNLSLNVNDYRERRQFTLHSLADTAVSRVIATGQPHSLPPMPASERRIVHMYLANHPHVTTSSQGVGKSRTIVVSPKP